MVFVRKSAPIAISFVYDMETLPWSPTQCGFTGSGSLASLETECTLFAKVSSKNQHQEWLPDGASKPSAASWNSMGFQNLRTSGQQNTLRRQEPIPVISYPRIKIYLNFRSKPMWPHLASSLCTPLWSI